MMIDEGAATRAFQQAMSAAQQLATLRVEAVQETDRPLSGWFALDALKSSLMHLMAAVEPGLRAEMLGELEHMIARQKRLMGEQP